MSDPENIESVMDAARLLNTQISSKVEAILDNSESLFSWRISPEIYFDIFVRALGVSVDQITEVSKAIKELKYRCDMATASSSGLSEDQTWALIQTLLVEDQECPSDKTEAICRMVEESPLRVFNSVESRPRLINALLKGRRPQIHALEESLALLFQLETYPMKYSLEEVEDIISAVFMMDTSQISPTIQALSEKHFSKELSHQAWISRITQALSADEYLLDSRDEIIHQFPRRMLTDQRARSALRSIVDGAIIVGGRIIGGFRNMFNEIGRSFMPQRTAESENGSHIRIPPPFQFAEHLTHPVLRAVYLRIAKELHDEVASKSLPNDWVLVEEEP